MPQLSKKYLLVLLALLLGGGLAAPVAQAQDEDINPVAMAINMIGDPQYFAGSPYEVLVQIEASGVGPDNTLAAMGVLITPPPGWEYLGTTAGPLGGPDIEPRGGSGVLEFAWINPPQQFPYEFSFTLSVPVSEEGTRFISGQGLYRTTGPELYTAPVIVTAEGVDNSPPVIELAGDNPLDWPLGEPFVDPGYTATDGADGDLTDKVTVLGSVDFTNEGSYTLTYVGVTDSSGNRGANVTRQVNVVDMGDNPTDPDPDPGKDDNDSVGSGGGGGGFAGRGGIRNRNNNRDADDNKKKRRARNRRNANQNAQNAAPNKTAALAQRLREQAMRNQQARNNGATPTQVVIPKTGGAAISNAVREAAEAAEAGQPIAGTETTTATAATPPGPRGSTPDYGEGEGEGEGALELAEVESTTPLVTLGSEPEPGVLAKITGALREMGPRQYTALGGILAVLILAVIVGAFTWKSAYRRTPRRRAGAEPEAKDTP